jgi:hypothetical protein
MHRLHSHVLYAYMLAIPVLFLGCADGVPGPLGTDDFAHSDASLQVTSQHAEETECRNVAGTMTGNVFAESIMSGDLDGYVVFAYAAPEVTVKGRAQHLVTYHQIGFDADNFFRTVDRGVMAPIDPPRYRLNNRYEIVEGIGKYANATGFLSIHGTLIIDESGADPDNGTIDVTYRGRICS